MTKLTCIICPRGCRLTVDENMNVTGNHCERGVIYAKNELTHPQRMVTSTVKIISDLVGVIPVKTSDNIPKEKMFLVINELNKIVVKAPIKVGDVIVKNILDLGVDIVSTREILE